LLFRPAGSKNQDPAYDVDFAFIFIWNESLFTIPSTIDEKR
jgi:hypothetical protein